MIVARPLSRPLRTEIGTLAESIARRAPLLLATVFLLLARPVGAQDFDALITERIFKPEEISLNLSRHIARMLATEQTDSVAVLIEAWEDRTGPTGPLQRVRALWSIRNGVFDPSRIDRRFVWTLVTYHEMAAYREVGSSDGAWLPYLHEDFDPQMQRLAASIDPATVTSRSAELTLLVYQDRWSEFREKARTDAYRSCELVRAYEAMRDEIRDQAEIGYVYFTVGTWTPTRELEPIGTHAELLLGSSLEAKSWSADFLLTLRPGNAAERFTYSEGSDRITTERYVGFGVFANVGARLLRTARSTTDLQVGVGLESQRFFYGDEDVPESTDFLGVPVGLTLRNRLRFRPEGAFSLETRLRFGFGNYSNGEGSSMTGTWWGIQIGVGQSDSRKYADLARLE